VRDFTNLQWPEAPFGAEQRPFGKHTDMLAAFAVEWADRPDAQPLPVGAATVYLRVRKHGSALDIDPDTLAIGFRANVIDQAADVPDLLALVDRALTRARRHAVIMAGHRFNSDLSRMTALSSVPMRGAAGVLAAWANRCNRERGVALMVDTDADARMVGAVLDMSLDPLPVPIPATPACCASVAHRVLTRCLAVGLTAAVYAGRYLWEGTFLIGDAIDRAAWDVLSDAPATGATRRHCGAAGHAHGDKWAANVGGRQGGGRERISPRGCWCAGDQ
jgi:hypothetical protein